MGWHCKSLSKVENETCLVTCPLGLGSAKELGRISRSLDWLDQNQFVRLVSVLGCLFVAG